MRGAFMNAGYVGLWSTAGASALTSTLSPSVLKRFLAARRCKTMVHGGVKRDGKTVMGMAVSGLLCIQAYCAAWDGPHCATPHVVDEVVEILVGLDGDGVAILVKVCGGLSGAGMGGGQTGEVLDLLHAFPRQGVLRAITAARQAWIQ